MMVLVLSIIRVVVCVSVWMYCVREMLYVFCVMVHLVSCVLCDVCVMYVLRNVFCYCVVLYCVVCVVYCL